MSCLHSFAPRRVMRPYRSSWAPRPARSDTNPPFHEAIPPARRPPPGHWNRRVRRFPGAAAATPSVRRRTSRAENRTKTGNLRQNQCHGVASRPQGLRSRLVRARVVERRAPAGGVTGRHRPAGHGGRDARGEPGGRPALRRDTGRPGRPGARRVVRPGRPGRARRPRRHRHRRRAGREGVAGRPRRRSRRAPCVVEHVGHHRRRAVRARSPGRRERALPARGADGAPRRPRPADRPGQPAPVRVRPAVAPRGR